MGLRIEREEPLPILHTISNTFFHLVFILSLVFFFHSFWLFFCFWLFLFGGIPKSTNIEGSRPMSGNKYNRAFATLSL